MKKQEVIDLASRRGLCVYEQYKGRKAHLFPTPQGVEIHLTSGNDTDAGRVE